MASRQQLRVKSLQRRCVRALQLQADLAEAACEMLQKLTGGDVSANDRTKLSRLHKQEDAAILAYLHARKDLIYALSRTASAVDRRVCRVVNVST
jgi:hypothetical protein